MLGLIDLSFDLGGLGFDGFGSADLYQTIETVSVSNAYMGMTD